MFPDLFSVPKNMAVSAVIGACYGYVFNADAKLAACAFAMRSLAQAVLFAVANPLFGGDLSIRSFKVYQATHSLIAVLSILAFRRLQLIAATGTFVLAGMEVVFLLSRLETAKAMEMAEKEAHV